MFILWEERMTTRVMEGGVSPRLVEMGVSHWQSIGRRQSPSGGGVALGKSQAAWPSLSRLLFAKSERIIDNDSRLGG
jgi:hypothetical protein